MCIYVYMYMFILIVIYFIFVAFARNIGVPVYFDTAISCSMFYIFNLFVLIQMRSFQLYFRIIAIVFELYFSYVPLINKILAVLKQLVLLQQTLNSTR